MDIGQPIFHKKKAGDEGSILEKAFWEKVFGIENALALYGFLKILCF